MSSGTDAPPDQPDADGKRAFDDAWNTLLDAAPPKPAQPSAPAADDASAKTLAWDDAARVEALRSGTSEDATPADATLADAAPDPADSVSGLADELHVGRTAEPDVALGGPRDEATMATMMSGSWAIATRDASPATSASAEPGAKDLRESDAEMAAIMGADKVQAPTSAPAPRLASEQETEPVTPITSAEIEAKAAEKPRAAPRRMVAPEPRRSTGRLATLPDEPPAKKLSLGWAAAAGVVIAGAIWWFQQPRGASLRNEEKRAVASNDVRRTEAKDPSRDRASTPSPVDARSQSTRDDAKTVEPRDAEPVVPAPTIEPTPTIDPPSKPTPKSEPVAPSKPTPVATSKPGTDPRTPPAGTPSEVAAVFVRLPVSPADLPPVGGVGATGVHVDRIEMGASYDKSGCGGVAERFSLAAIDRVNVCLRVVHPRQEETVSIVWSKNDGSSARRGKIAIKPMHAYRTRAYLVLRKEYVGDWTVRILSADGVELASHAFTIGP